MMKMPISTESLTPSAASFGSNSTSERPMPANRIAEPAARIFTERPQATSIAMVVRQIAEATNTLVVADVTIIRKV